jgi:hypothetical protein
MPTIRAVIFLIAGKLDFRVINRHAPQPTWNSLDPLYSRSRQAGPRPLKSE